MDITLQGEYISWVDRDVLQITILCIQNSIWTPRIDWVINTEEQKSRIRGGYLEDYQLIITDEAKYSTIRQKYSYWLRQRIVANQVSEKYSVKRPLLVLNHVALIPLSKLIVDCWTWFVGQKIVQGLCASCIPMNHTWNQALILL